MTPFLQEHLTEKVIEDTDLSKYTNLIWSDEFDGNSLNTNNWNLVAPVASPNNELQKYTTSSENCYVSDGSLKIVANNCVQDAQVVSTKLSSPYSSTLG